jgi:uncharacterized protein YbjT (DUF2867 family)
MVFYRIRLKHLNSSRMHIILGATGHIGSVLVKLLAERGEQVTGVTRNRDNVAQIEAAGAKAAVVDVQDTEALRELFKKGTRLYLLNPPGNFGGDASAEEKQSLSSIISALADSSIEKIVAESTYGAQPGDQLGDLDVLYGMEQALAMMPRNVTILRGSYYMSNFAMDVRTARSEGKIFTLFPTDFKIPMVAPEDIARFAVDLLLEPKENTGMHYVTGPDDYTPQDVANAFAKAFGHPVAAVTVERRKWKEFLMGAGFSETSAISLMNMTDVTLEQKFEVGTTPKRGRITIENYIDNLVKRQEHEMAE